MRYTTVIMNQVASLRKRVFFTGIKKGWYDGLYIGIGYERTFPRPGAEFDGYVDPAVRKLISGIRTDLDMFNDMIGSTCEVERIAADGAAWVAIWWNGFEGPLLTSVGLAPGQMEKAVA